MVIASCGRGNGGKPDQRLGTSKLAGFLILYAAIVLTGRSLRLIELVRWTQTGHAFNIRHRPMGTQARPLRQGPLDVGGVCFRCGGVPAPRAPQAGVRMTVCVGKGMSIPPASSASLTARFISAW